VKRHLHSGATRLISKVSYRLDALALAAIAAAALDAWTTYYFIAHDLGFEANPVLAPLARHSLIWIPAYILAQPLLIPMVPDVCRQSFATGFLVAGLLCGINNLCGIYAGRYILVDLFGFPVLVAVSVLAGMAAFVYQLVSNGADRDLIRRSVAAGARWIVIFCAMDATFYLVAQLLG
jgi:hypothetical protein